MRSAIVIYLVYTLLILTVGYYAYTKMSDAKNPSSLRSSVKELNDVLNEDY